MMVFTDIVIYITFYVIYLNIQSQQNWFKLDGFTVQHSKYERFNCSQAFEYSTDARLHCSYVERSVTPSERPMSGKSVRISC